MTTTILSIPWGVAAMLLVASFFAWLAASYGTPEIMSDGVPGAGLRIEIPAMFLLLALGVVARHRAIVGPVLIGAALGCASYVLIETFGRIGAARRERMERERGERP